MPRKENYEYAVVTVDTNDGVHLIGQHDYHLSLDDLYKYSNCDTIQIVRTDVFKPNPFILMCIDDNGKLLQKPINLMGTVLYGQWPNDFIVGDVCIGTSWSPNPNDEPDMFALPYEQAEEIAHFLQSLKR